MSDLPEILTRAFADKEVFTPSGEKRALHSNISEEECCLLYETVRRVRPAVSLEIGFAQGISTLAILKALEDNGAGHHHVIDPFQSRYDYCGIAMVERAGPGGRFSFYEKLAEEVIPGLPRVQFAFIDSSHLFDLTLSEFVLVDRKLEIGGAIGLHDMWMPAQQAAIRYILANRAYVLDDAAQPAAGGVKALMRGVAARLPMAERIFSAEFLKPWKSFGIPNLVVLRKRDEDRRDWKRHVRF
jgi:hypothetical protein